MILSLKMKTTCLKFDYLNVKILTWVKARGVNLVGRWKRPPACRLTDKTLSGGDRRNCPQICSDTDTSGRRPSRIIRRR